MRYALALIVAAGCVEPDLGTSASEVIGGAVTPEGMYPAVGALYEGGAAFCTGTLIAPDAVLTAAHCLEGATAAPGFTLASDTRGGVAAVPGRSFVVHPMWDIDRAIADGPTLYYDIAIVKLAQPITDVTPAIIPSRAEAAGLVEGKTLTMVGFGQTIDGDAASAGVKHHASAPIVNQSPSEMQLSNPGQPQNCYGDSGGPAFVDLGAGLRVVGVVSRGATTAVTCDAGGIDTRVDFFGDWVRQQVPTVCVGGQVCAGGTAPPNDVTGFGAEITGGCAAGGSRSGGGAVVVIAMVAARRRRRRAIA